MQGEDIECSLIGVMATPYYFLNFCKRPPAPPPHRLIFAVTQHACTYIKVFYDTQHS